MRELIKKPRSLLRVEAEKHWFHKGDFDTIKIVTDKGTYLISGCTDCGSLSWKKLDISGEM